MYTECHHDEAATGGMAVSGTWKELWRAAGPVPVAKSIYDAPDVAGVGDDRLQ
jgi:muconolactone delta-isomerase